MAWKRYSVGVGHVPYAMEKKDGSNKEGACPTVRPAKKEERIHPERDILSNRLNAGILQKPPGILRIPFIYPSFNNFPCRKDFLFAKR